MRICLISREYPPETGWGGIATFARHLAHGLQEQGHEVEVVSLAVDQARTSIVEGVPVHRVTADVISGNLAALSFCIPYSRYVLQTSTALWKKFLELHAEKPFDLIDTPELLAEGLLPAITKAVPLVIRLYTPHSKFIAEKLHNVKPSFDHEFVAALERVAMLSADALTSPSDDLANFVAGDLGIDQKTIKIVRNPIDPVDFSPEGHKALPSDGRVTVLFVGRLEERKGIHYLIDAIPQVLKVCPNARFIVIGDDTKNAAGQKSVMPDLKQSLADSGCTEAVTFIPRIPLKELPAYYRSADISCVPSVYDNSPYTCLEAMSCGRPVIGTSGGGTIEYVVDGESGVIVPPRDTNALAEALIKLCQSAAERRRLGDNARKRVLEKFQRKEIARQMLEVYELARQRFSVNKDNALYPKDISEVLPDAEYILYSLDRMIYDMLYTHSYSFRLQHWWRLGKQRPKLLMAKVLFGFARGAFKICGIKTGAPHFWLQARERDIECKQFLGSASGPVDSLLEDPFDDLFIQKVPELSQR